MTKGMATEMDEKRTIILNLPEKEITFQMLLGTNSICDVATRYYLDAVGACEPEVCHLMARTVRHGDTVIDAGANIGFFTLLLAKLVGQHGSVIAFEPAEQNVAKLKDNIALNKLNNVNLYEEALYFMDYPVQLWTGMDSGIASLKRAPDHLSSTKVPGVMLKNYATACRLIKLDIEGSELNALQGGGELIRPENCPYIVCELNTVVMNHFGYGIRDVREAMRTRGYDLFLLRNDGGMPAMLTKRTNLTSDKKNLNVLFSTPLAVAEAWPEIHFASEDVNV
jgi:FkbM family methyltransferase